MLYLFCPTAYSYNLAPYKHGCVFLMLHSYNYPSAKDKMNEFIIWIAVLIEDIVVIPAFFMVDSI